MIDETILFLRRSSCSNSRLKKHEKELDIEVRWEPDVRVIQPLKKIFSEVLQYDFGKNYSEYGVSKTNNQIIDLVCEEHPKYLLWPASMYEIQESTFQAIRKEGAFVIGWFFDDEDRFDNYSKWWVPYLDYIWTCDKVSVAKYRDLGATAMHMLGASNPEVFKRLVVPRKYDVSFVGTNYSDRNDLVNILKANNIQVKAFGKGWPSEYIAQDEVVKVYNETKINLVFSKSYAITSRPQIKDKIFDICMCGGFLLSEYVSGIEDYYEIDKEIVCFGSIEEAAVKIKYYLSHESERQEIAQAGWERAQRDHDQFKWMSRIFKSIENDTRERDRLTFNNLMQIDIPQHIRHQSSFYHLRWATVLMGEGFDRHRWKEELDLAFFYDPENAGARRLRVISRLPAFVYPWLLHMLNFLGRLKKRLRSHLACISLLRKIKQTLACRFGA